MTTDYDPICKNLLCFENVNMFAKLYERINHGVSRQS